jgi:hypothetical protein
MPTRQVPQLLDRATAEALAERFAKVFATFEPSDLFAPNAFFDLNMPVWRFQLQGGDAFASQLRSINHGDARVEIARTVPTASGFVTEQIEFQDLGDEEVWARRIWLCEVTDGRISEVVGYCSGEWNEELATRHAAQAPMIRP